MASNNTNPLSSSGGFNIAGFDIDGILNQINFPRALTTSLLADEMASYEAEITALSQDLLNTRRALDQSIELLDATNGRLTQVETTLASTTAAQRSQQPSQRNYSNDFRGHYNTTLQARDALTAELQTLHTRIQAMSAQSQNQSQNYRSQINDLANQLQAERDRNQPLAQRLQTTTEALDQLTGMADRGIKISSIDFVDIWNRYEASKSQNEHLMAMSAAMRESEEKKTRDALAERDVLQGRLDELESKDSIQK